MLRVKDNTGQGILPGIVLRLKAHLIVEFGEAPGLPAAYDLARADAVLGLSYPACGAVFAFYDAGRDAYAVQPGQNAENRDHSETHRIPPV